MLGALLLARFLSSEQFASYSYFQLTTSMLSSYLGMGLGVAASRFFADACAGDRDEPPIGLLWGTSIVIALLATAIIALSPSNWITAGLPVSKWLLVAGTFLFASQIVPDGAILGLEKYRQIAAISALSGAAMLAGVAFAVAYKSPVLGVLSLMAYSLIQTIGESIIVIRTIGWTILARTCRVKRSNFKAILHVSGPMLLVSLLSASGVWVLGRLILRSSGSNSFALYSLGMQWFSFALLVPGMVSRVVLPRIVRASRGELREKTQLTRQAASIAFSAAAMVAVVGAAASPFLMGLYGAKYTSHRWLLAGYMFAAMLFSPANTIGNALVASNSQVNWLLLTVAWFVSLVGVGLVTQPLGEWSGAVAQCVASLCLTALAAVSARKKQLL